MVRLTPPEITAGVLAFLAGWLCGTIAAAFIFTLYG
jgi:hypothetical protein